MRQMKPVLQDTSDRMNNEPIDNISAIKLADTLARGARNAIQEKRLHKDDNNLKNSNIIVSGEEMRRLYENGEYR